MGPLHQRLRTRTMLTFRLVVPLLNTSPFGFLLLTNARPLSLFMFCVFFLLCPVPSIISFSLNLSSIPRVAAVGVLVTALHPFPPSVLFSPLSAVAAARILPTQPTCHLHLFPSFSTSPCPLVSPQPLNPLSLCPQPITFVLCVFFLDGCEHSVHAWVPSLSFLLS